MTVDYPAKMEPHPLSTNQNGKDADSPPRLDEVGGMSARGKARIRVFWEQEPSADAQERLLAAFEMLFTEVSPTEDHEKEGRGAI
jgi:hypothetical protein